MSALTNRQLKLASRPVGLPKPSDFTLETAPVRAPEEGEVVVKALYASLDPAIACWLKSAAWLTMALAKAQESVALRITSLPPKFTAALQFASVVK